MDSERAIPTLSLQQQAETKHVQIRSDGHVENDEPDIPRLPPLRQLMRPRGKRLTPAQEEYLSARYADRIPAGHVAPAEPGHSAPVEPMTEHKRVGEARPRSSSADSEEIVDVLRELGDPQASHNEPLDPRSTESLPKSYRNPDQKLSAEVPVGVDTALAEVLQQLDDEDEEASHGDTDDNDYAEDSPAKTRHRDRVTGAQTTSSIKPGYTKTRPKKYRKINSGRIAEAKKDDSHAGSNYAPEADPEQFLEGLPLVWPSWEEFTAAFTDFQEATFQQFVAHTSTSVAIRNAQIKAAQIRAARKSTTKKAGASRKPRSATGGTLLPESWEVYSKTYLCTHGMPFEAKGTGKISHTKIRATGCCARVNARAKLRRGGGAGFHLVVKAKGTHNHALSPHTWYNCASNRRIQDENLREEVAVMSRAGAKPKGILAHLRAKTGKRTVLRDVHNMIQDAKKRFDPGSTDGDRALKVLDEFCEGAPGNTAEFVLDSGSGVVRVITFQSARMRRLFAAFPEVVLVDSTHDTNSNRYKLFSFAIHDVFGRGQYVQHALVITEEKPNLAIAVATFNKNNPAWTKIRVVMTDKALH
ncbi:hypothetical protein PR003_g24984, partial [Phytophthora rubi]